MDGRGKTGSGRKAGDVAESCSSTVPRPWLSSRPDEPRPLYPCACTRYLPAARALPALLRVVCCVLVLPYACTRSLLLFFALVYCCCHVHFPSDAGWTRNGRGNRFKRPRATQQHPRANAMIPTCTLPVLVPALRASNPCRVCIVMCCVVCLDCGKTKMKRSCSRALL